MKQALVSQGLDRQQESSHFEWPDYKPASRTQCPPFPRGHFSNPDTGFSTSCPFWSQANVSATAPELQVACIFIFLFASIWAPIF